MIVKDQTIGRVETDRQILQSPLEFLLTSHDGECNHTCPQYDKAFGGTFKKVLKLLRDTDEFIDEIKPR